MFSTIQHRGLLATGLGTLPVMHLLLWCGLGLLTIVLIVLVVTKWGKTRPLHTCAVLSLLAHVLLACLATVVRIVASMDQVAEGPPIRVRIVSEAPSPVHEPTPQPEPSEPQVLETAEEPAEPPAEESPPAEEAVVLDEPSPDSEPEQIAAQEPLPLPPTTPMAEIVAVPETIPETKTPAPEAETTAEPQGEQVATVSDPEPPAPVQVETTLDTGEVATPQPYINRQRSDRLGFVIREGGSRETEAAVRAALEWLAAAQSSDGSWKALEFGAGQERNVLGHNRQGAGTKADTGISSLAVLAFLGAGYTHQAGDYEVTLVDGLEFLIASQAADGNLGGSATRYAHMYCHSMSTFALAEAMAQSGDPRLRDAVRRAINYTLRAQHPTAGGWRYRSGQEGDTSQLGWQLMALRSAELAGLDVPSQTWTRAERFLRSVRRGAAGGLAAYTPHSKASRPMTAEALYCRQLLAASIGGTVGTAAAEEAAQHLLSELPGHGQPNLYYWYYATLALHHQQDVSSIASRAWKEWNSAMKQTLVSSQVIRGPEAGSWSPNTMWGGYGGRVYSTALAALCLEVYYRYDAEREHPQQWIASERDEPRQLR